MSTINPEQRLRPEYSSTGLPVSPQPTNDILENSIRLSNINLSFHIIIYFTEFKKKSRIFCQLQQTLLLTWKHNV